MNSPILNAITKLHQKISKQIAITPDELMVIQPIAKIQELNAEENFIRAGESAQKIALVIKGLAKTSYIFDNGKEIIGDFITEGNLLGIYTDMLKGVPSTGYAVAIEPCTLLVMDYKEMLSITKDSLAWAHFLRKFAEERYISRSEKERNISLKTAKEKYEYFKQTNPLLLERLPLNQVALYLNITPATLSRLRNSSGKYRNNL